MMIDVYWLCQRLPALFVCLCVWMGGKLMLIHLVNEWDFQFVHKSVTITSFFVARCQHSNLRPYNLQGETHGACLAWPLCRESGRFTWVVCWTASSRTGICSTSQPAMAYTLLALQWKSPSWMPTTTVPSVTRSGIHRNKDVWNEYMQSKQTESRLGNVGQWTIVPLFKDSWSTNCIYSQANYIPCSVLSKDRKKISLLNMSYDNTVNVVNNRGKISYCGYKLIASLLKNVEK